MSDKAMSRLYQARSFSTTPTNSGGGLDLFGIQERRQARQLQLQKEIQKELADHEALLQKQAAEAQEALEEKLRNNSTVTKAATEAGLPIDQFVKSIVPRNVDVATQAATNRLMEEKNRGVALDPDQNPDILTTNRMGANLAASGLPPNALFGSVGMGGVGLHAGVPGVSIPSGSQPNPLISRGATPFEKDTLQGGIMDPKTGMIIGGRPVKQSGMIPGNVIQAPNVSPFSSQELQKAGITPPQTSFSTTPQSSMDPDQPFPMITSPQNAMAGISSMTQQPNPISMPDDNNGIAPIPANKQTKNGAITTTPQAGAPLNSGMMELLKLLIGGNVPMAPQSQTGMQLGF
jgi:hypothetical protein